MSYLERDFSYKNTTEKTVTLIGAQTAVGRLFNAAKTKGGAMPRFSPVNTGYSPSIYNISCGFVAKDGTMFLVSRLALYCKPSGEKTFTVIASGLARTPFFAEYDGGILISDGVTDYTYCGGELTSCESLMPLYGGIIHYSRLFGVDLSDGYTVRWSAAGTVDDWSEGIRNSGWLKLSPEKGEVLQLISYNDKLIAVRERGLTVIRVYGDTENFRINGTDTNTDDIISGTAAVCANKLFFATNSGLYSYDGSDINKEEDTSLDGLGRILAGTACGNYYFASVYLDGDLVVACINGESGETSFCNITADYMFASGEAYVASAGTLYRLYYPAGTVVWDSGYINLGSDGKKFLKSVYIDSLETCNLTVESNGVSRIFTDVNGKVKVKMSGDKFRFSVTSNVAVNSLEAAVEV